MCPQPHRGSFLFSNLSISSANLSLWCRLSTSLLPDLVGTIVSISCLSDSLDVDGAKVKLPSKLMFESKGADCAFKGSLTEAGTHIMRNYQQHLRSSWQSVVNNSNAVLGGLLTRHAWNPKRRHVTLPRKPVVCIERGQVVIDEAAFNNKCCGALAPLTNEGYQQVASLRSVEEMILFIRRSVCMIGGRIVDDASLSRLCQRYTDDARTYAALLGEISDPDCHWIQPT